MLAPRTVVVALVLVLVLATFGTASAQMLFDFAWTSWSSYSTLVRVNRVEPDGSVTPYDEVRFDGTRSGTGVLALTRTDSGFDFTFSGPGGAGSGSALAAGEILSGRASVPLAPDVPVRRPGDADLSGGSLTFTGPPAAPLGVSIAYLEAVSPHCLVNCSRISFSGSGSRSGAPVTAGEPSSVLLVGLAMLALARLRRGRR